MTNTLTTTLRRFSFDVSTADGKAAWRAFKAERASGPPCHGPVISDVWAAFADMDGQTLELDPGPDARNLFNNQWNTAGDKGRRVFDYALQSTSSGGLSAGREISPQNIRRGYYLEQTEAMREIRRNTNACGYCGHKEEAARGSVFCPRCIDSEYLKEGDLHLTRMGAVDEYGIGAKSREPLTDAERAHLLPLYTQAQTHGTTERGKARIAAFRQSVEAKAEKVTRQAEEERAGMIWLIDNGLGQVAAQNVLFYNHTGRFGFGWRDGGLGPEVVSRLLDVMSEFPGSYDIKTADGRTLSGN